MVYAKKPFGTPQTVLDYLGRYTHRVALSNDRILQVENREVTLSYRDRKDGDRKTTITLEAQEFIRRFLLHVLPDGFVRIRHFGFLANRSKKQALAQCRNLLKLDPALPEPPILSVKDRLLKITGVDLSRCPCCQIGTLIVVGDLPASPSLPRWDSAWTSLHRISARVTLDRAAWRGCAWCQPKRALKLHAAVPIAGKLSLPISTLAH